MGTRENAHRRALSLDVVVRGKEKNEFLHAFLRVFESLVHLRRIAIDFLRFLKAARFHKHTGVHFQEL